MKGFLSLIAAALSVAPFIVSATPTPRENDNPNSVVNRIKCAGKTFTYHGMVGYGDLPGNFTDKTGDTMSTGSGMAITGWKSQKGGKSYKATAYMLPDRGWNTEGTTAYQPRIHKLSLTFKPAASYPSGNNIIYKYEDTILFVDPNGNPLAGLDPTTTLKFGGFPDLPAAKFPGDGFGGAGSGGTRVSLDSEGLVLDTASEEGGFWISDEYGPFIYHFDKKGKMDYAVRPPNALIPIRKGKENFSSNNPPIYDRNQRPDPIDPESGRSNNQGFEGLTFDKKEKALYALLQSATINDGGADKRTNRYARLLKYQLDKEGWNPKLAGEWTVPLPQYIDPTTKKNPRTAAQSEILSLGEGRFLVLARDSGFGRGQDNTKSVYRHVDVFSISEATNFKGKYDDFKSSYAPGGKLDESITPAEYCSFLDFNVPSELAKFGLLNGGDDNNAEGLLNEKWEGLSMVPVDGKEGEYFLFASNDNDFITQDGHYNFGKGSYKDGSGFDLVSQTLAFKVSIKQIQMHERDYMYL